MYLLTSIDKASLGGVEIAAFRSVEDYDNFRTGVEKKEEERRVSEASLGRRMR